jgi:hypothetical protein
MLVEFLPCPDICVLDTTISRNLLLSCQSAGESYRARQLPADGTSMTSALVKHSADVASALDRLLEGRTPARRLSLSQLLTGTALHDLSTIRDRFPRHCSTRRVRPACSAVSSCFSRITLLLRRADFPPRLRQFARCMPQMLRLRRGYAGGKGRAGGVASVMRLPSGSRSCANVE